MVLVFVCRVSLDSYCLAARFPLPGRGVFGVAFVVSVFVFVHLCWLGIVLCSALFVCVRSVVSHACAFVPASSWGVLRCFRLFSYLFCSLVISDSHAGAVFLPRCRLVQEWRRAGCCFLSFVGALHRVPRRFFFRGSWASCSPSYAPSFSWLRCWAFFCVIACCPPLLVGPVLGHWRAAVWPVEFFSGLSLSFVRSSSPLRSCPLHCCQASLFGCCRVRVSGRVFFFSWFRVFGFWSPLHVSIVSVSASLLYFWCVLPLPPSPPPPPTGASRVLVRFRVRGLGVRVWGFAVRSVFPLCHLPSSHLG